MKGKNRRKDNTVAGEDVAQALSIDTILAQLVSMKDNALSFIVPEPADPEAQEIWKADVEACEAATAILSALQDEGIRDPEQVRDLVHDYKALAEQYQKMHQQYEEPAKVLRLGTGARAACLCPKCRNQSRPGNAYCWNCGKRLDWGR